MDVNEAWRCIRACATYLREKDDSPRAARDLIEVGKVLERKETRESRRHHT